MAASTNPSAGDDRVLENSREREAATLEILEAISRSRDDEKPVFDTILRSALRLCNVDMSVLVMLNEAGTHLELTASAGAQFVKLKPGVDQWPIDSGLTVARAFRERRNIVTEDLRDDELYRQGEPTRVALVDKEGMRSQLVIPLLNGERAIGSFVLQRREKRSFTPDEITLLQSFAAQAVIAIENVRQFRALEKLNAELGDRVEKQVGEIERMGRLKRFLPSAVADAVVSSGSEKMLESHRALLGILFCDIRGFTAFCERAEPEETIEVLQTYHEAMGHLIAESAASVDHRMGDGIMVLFNDPIPCDDPAGEAVRLALAMQERMKALCSQWKRLGHRLGFGVGVALGYATVGMVGSEGRQEYTASGTAVNLASRLCDKAEDGEILLSPRAHIATEDNFDAHKVGEITLKGIQDAIEVFRVTGPKAAG